MLTSQPTVTPSARHTDRQLLRSRIAGLGMYVPSRVVTNAELERRLGCPPGHIEKASGIKERRHVVAGQQSCSDLAVQASLRALQAAELAPSDLDLILFATLSADHYFPGAGCYLQAQLNLPGTPVMDIHNQCSGFLYGLRVADQFIATGTYRNILVVGSEVHSVGLDYSPRGAPVTILFGDGAGAAVVGPAQPGFGLLGAVLHADGRHADDLSIPAPGTRYAEPINSDLLVAGLHYPHMNGVAVFKAAVDCMSKVTLELCEQLEVPIEDIDLFVFHQANLRILEAVLKRLAIPPQRVYTNLSRYGNTTAASIPIALAEAQAEGRVRPGDRVALVAFGSGFTWAGLLYRW